MFIVWKCYERFVDILDSSNMSIKSFDRNNMPSNVFGYSNEDNLFFFSFYNIDSFNLILAHCTTLKYEFVIGSFLTRVTGVPILRISRQEFNNCLNLLRQVRNIPYLVCYQLNSKLYKLIYDLENDTKTYVAKYRLATGISIYDSKYQLFDTKWFFTHLVESVYHKNISYSYCYYLTCCSESNIKCLESLGCSVTDDLYNLKRVVFNFSHSSTLFSKYSLV